MNHGQLASVRCARLQLLDLGEEKAAATLDWAAAMPESVVSDQGSAPSETGTPGDRDEAA